MCLAVPGKVIDLEDSGLMRMATVDFGGVQKRVCVAYLPDVQVDEYVIVHVGFAIQRLDEASARRSLEMFERTGLIAEEFGDAWAQAADPARGPTTGPTTGLPDDVRPSPVGPGTGGPS